MTARTAVIARAGALLLLTLAPFIVQAAAPVIPALSLVDNPAGGKT